MQKSRNVEILLVHLTQLTSPNMQAVPVSKLY